jgi:hypothetical protein
MNSHPYDARYEAARATDQSGQRGWHFPPATAAPSRVAFYIRTAVQLAAVAGFVAVVWVALS